MDILGMQNSNDTVMPPWKLAASVQPLVFIFFHKNIDELQINCSLKKGILFLQHCFLVALLYSRRGKNWGTKGWSAWPWSLGRWWNTWSCEPLLNIQRTRHVNLWRGNPADPAWQSCMMRGTCCVTLFMLTLARLLAFSQTSSETNRGRTA